MPNKADLLGLVVGELTVIADAPSVKGRAYWKCGCNCGAIIIKAFYRGVQKTLSFRAGMNGPKNK